MTNETNAAAVTAATNEPFLNFITSTEKALEGPLKALTKHKQFIVYKLTPNDKGKMDKIPVHYLTGKNCNCHDPNNQIDHVTAICATRELIIQFNQQFGVGFVLTEEVKLFCIDIDNALVQIDNTSEWSPKAKELCTVFNGAAIEVSSSGKGLHIFGTYTGEIKHTCKNKQFGIELYTKDRFIALTGYHAFGNAGMDCTDRLQCLVTSYLPSSISTNSLSKDSMWTTEPCEGYAGNELTDEQLIEHAIKSKPSFIFGGKSLLRDLLEGDMSAFPSASEADFAVAKDLLYWNGKDCERTERLMRESKLYREKWDAHKTYLRDTIMKANSMQTEYWGSKTDQQAHQVTEGNSQNQKVSPNCSSWNQVSIADIFTNPPKPQLFFIDGWLPASVLTFFAGHGGTGKSMLALQASVCLALGVPFMGKKTIKCRVLFFSAEDSTETIRRRLIKICNSMQISATTLSESLEVIDATKSPYLFTENTNKKSETTNEYAELRKLIRTFNTNVIIIDNASDTFDANENNRAQVRAFVRALVQLGEESHTTVLLLAHVDKLTAKGEGSSESYSGVTAWHNSARSRWYLTNDGNVVLLQHKKSNFGPLSPEIKMGWSPEGFLICLSNNDLRVLEEDMLTVVLTLIKRNYEQEIYISPAANSGTNAYNTLKRDAEFPKSINRQKQLTPLLERAINKGQLCVEEYNKDGNTKKRYKVNESIQGIQS